MPEKEILCLGAGGKTQSPVSRFRRFLEPLDEITHRTNRGGNCELWGYKATKGSDEKPQENHPAPQQNLSPRIQHLADC